MDTPPPRLFAILVAGFLLQLSLFNQLRLFGVAPEVPLMMAVLAGMFIGFEQAAPIVFGLGLLYDIAIGTPVGSWGLVCVVAAYPLGVASPYMDRKTGAGLWALGGAFTFVGVCSFAMFTWLLGRSEYSHGVPKIAVFASVYNMILWPLFNRAFTWTEATPRRGRGSLSPRQGYRL